MSHEITCTNCETPNPPGSKFCNNCGHQLPKGTKIICPNCQTPNPRNRFYCDNCGARLVEERLPEEPEADDKKPNSGVEAFNLPSRDPGETAHFKPNAIPDWLKTGELSSTKEEEEEEPAAEEPKESDELPSLEEVAPLRKSTDELPDWLVDEQLTSAPPFRPPQEITTDHFLELLEAEEIDDELDEEELIQAAEGANLPDWLNDVVDAERSATASAGAAEEEDTAQGETSESEPASPPPEEEADAGAPQEWLTQLGPLSGGRGFSTDDLSAVGPERPPEEEADDAWDEEPSWLTGDVEAEAKEEEEEEDFAEPTSGIFSTSEFGEQVLGGDELPDWLADADEEEAEEAETPSGGVGEEEDVSDIFASETFAQDLEEALDSDLPDWLTDTEAEAEAAAAETAVPPDPQTGAEDAFPDWLSDLEDTETEPDLAEEAALEETAVPPADPQTGAEDAFPDWLSDLEDTETEADLAEEATLEETAVPPPDSQTGAEDAFPDWLSDLEETETESEAAPETTMAAEEETASELDQVGEPFADAEPSEPLLDDLPDWLSDLEGAGDAPPDTEADEFAALFSAEAGTADLMPDWLQEVEAEETEETEEEEEEEAADALLPPEEAVAESEPDDLFADDASRVDEAPDWLTEFSAADSDEAVLADADLEEAPPPEEETPPAEALLSEEEVIEAEETIPLEPTAAEEEAEAEADFPLGEEPPEAEFDPEAGDLPEWLTQLDAAETAATESEAAGEEALSGGDLPEWLSRLRPEEDKGQERISSFPGLAVDTDLPSEFDEIPDELAGADLPDWLEEATRSDPALVDDEELLFIDDQSEIPDWLRKDVDAAEIGMETAADDASRDELNELIASLPPSRHPAEELAKADLPDWVKAMQPKEEEETTAVAEEEAAPLSGPLSGIRGAIEIEPIIAEPRTAAAAIPTFTFTDEQQQQGALLRQVSQTISLRGGRIAPLGGRTLPAPVRLGLALLLLIIVLLGLLGPNLLRPLPAAAPEPVTAVHDILEDAAGQPVLVAFEYTPAMAAELEPQAELLLSQLAENDSEVIVISQYPAGLALAEAAVAGQPSQMIGYIPGEAIGLREVGNCLRASGACDAITTHMLSPDLQAAMEEVEVTILLTGERDSLLNWIEQVGVIGRVTLVAGLTQALQPVAQPYLAADQIGGMLAGTPDTAAYAAAFAEAPEPPLQARWNAQHLAQLLAALLLIAGGVIYGVSGNLGRERDKNA